MKKLIIIAAVIVLGVAAWAGATLYVGNSARDYYFGNLEKYGRFGPIAIKNRSYMKSFFDARAETVLDITVPAGKDEESGELLTESVQMVFEHRIQHGPFVSGRGPNGNLSLAPAAALIETRLAGIESTEAKLAALLDTIPELREAVAIARISYDGETQSLLTVPGFNKQVKETELGWGGLTVAGVYHPVAGTMVGSLDMPQLTIRGEDGLITWDGASADFDLVEALPMLYVGTTNVTYRGLEADMPVKDKPERQAFSMAGIDMTSTSRFDGAMLHYDQGITFNGLTVDGETFGPLELEMEAKNLDGQVLSAFQQQMLDFYASDAFNDPEQLAAQLLPMYSELMIGLLPGEPEMKIRRFHLTTPMGVADGSFNLRVSALPAEAVEQLRQNPLAALQYVQYLDSALDLVADETLVRSALSATMESQVKNQIEQARQANPELEIDESQLAQMVEQQLNMQLEMLVAQNFIERDGNRLKSHATFSDGELMVNGNPLPLLQGGVQ